MKGEERKKALDKGWTYGRVSGNYWTWYKKVGGLTHHYGGALWKEEIYDD